MSKEEELRISILEYIESISPEELYRTTKNIEIPNFDKKEVIYEAYEMKKEGLIEAAIGKHNLGVERVIPRGLTPKGKEVLKDYRKTWFQKVFPIYKKEFREQFVKDLARWSVLLIFLLIGYFLRYIQEMLF